MTHSECYGKMFPSVLEPTTGKVLRGQAFSIELQRPGGWTIASRDAQVDLDAWEGCVGCQEFEHCYRLSMATLALQAAVLNSN